VRLIERLISGADAAAAAGDLDQAREMANDVLMVDPDNEQALDLLRSAQSRQRSRMGERMVMTVMFSDLVDSTPLADVEEPEIVRDVFSLYREEAKRAVERFGGQIVSYQGDGVVAAFGYPQVHEDDARRAVNAGLDLVVGMQQVADRARERHGVDAEVRVGIHTGMAVVADIGSGRTIERGAIVGVTPNLAARIQAAAEPGQVVISDVTQHVVDSDFDLEPLGARSLKGIARDVELYRVIGARHVSDRLSADRFAAAPMVGRDAALEKLTAAWNAVLAGTESEATLVLGAAGVGKSRLIAEFSRKVELGPGDMFIVGCLPFYATSALWPVSQSLMKNLGIKPDDSEADRINRLTAGLETSGLDVEANLGLLGPLIGVEVVPRHPAPQLDPTALRQALLHTLLRLITGATNGRPRAIVTEDVHWADPSTLDLLGMLSAAETPNVMLLMTSRSPLETAWKETVGVMELGRLNDPEARALVDHLAGAGLLDEAARRAIVARAAGVPLFIEELTRSALTSGAELPVRLQELLAARLREPGVDLDLAQAAATVGNEFDAEVLAAVIDDPAELPQRLESLQQAEIIDPTDDPGGTRYRFRHALLRDAAYETQVLDSRRDGHGRIAAALAEGGGDAAVVARHFDLAGSVSEAIGQYSVAVQAAQASGAHEEAIQLASRALELIEGLPEGAERSFAELSMLMLRGLSVSSIRGYAAPEVGADFRRANQLSELLGTAPEVMPAAFAIWSFSLVNGDIPTAGLLAQRLRARVEDGSGAWFAPEVDAALGYQALYEGRLAESEARFADAAAGFDARPTQAKVSEYWPLPNDPIAINLVGMAVVTALRGDLVRSGHFAAQAVQRADEVPFPRGPFSAAFVKVYLAWVALLLGDLIESQRLGEETTAIGQQYGYAYWMALGSIYHRVTDPDVAAFEESMAMLRGIGHEAFRASYLAYLAWLQRAAGRSDEALQTVHDALLEIEKSGEMLHRPDLVRMRGELTLETRGDAAEGVADLIESLDLAVESGNAIYGLRAGLQIGRLDERSRPDRWRDRLAAQVALFSEDAEFEDLASARALLRES